MKRKPKVLKNDKTDFKGLGEINVNGKNIDLLYLAHDASDEFEANLNKLTEGMDIMIDMMDKRETSELFNLALESAMKECENTSRACWKLGQRVLRNNSGANPNHISQMQ
ncbi:hypothetical protein Tco_0688432 [Tanacetum coccineum]